MSELMLCYVLYMVVEICVLRESVGYVILVYLIVV